MSAHTPGPWKVLADTRTGAVDVWSGARFVCTVGVPGASGDESIEPDAALIAAAPDLLAALKEARRSIAVTADILGCEAALMPIMDAAIARAEGRS